MQKIFTAFIAPLIVLTACSSLPSSQDEAAQEAQTSQEKPVVAATFYPLAEFARNIGQDNIEIFTITPAGTDPHQYEPTPRQVASLDNADLFLINGAGQDPWAEKVASSLTEKGVNVLTIADYVTPLEASEEAEEDEHHDEEHHEEEEHEDEHHDEEEDHDDDDHEHAEDPHFWLDPLLAIQQVDLIAETLMQIDPTNQDAYANNAKDYQAQLTDLHNRYQSTLASCQKRDFITSHQAFGHLANRYDLNQIAISGISTEQEPSPQHLATVADLAQEKNITVIFFGTLVSPKLAETLASEVQAQTMVLNPLEGLTQEQILAGENYVTIMESNLVNLAQALECQAS